MKRKMSFFKKWGIPLLVTILIITTSISFVFWSAGILGSSDSGDGSIRIGEGRYATTKISLDDPTITNGDLVPLTVTPLEGEITTVVIEFNVKWIAVQNPDQIVDETEGILSVTCNSIMAGENELIEETVEGDASLFLIDLGGEDGVYSITGNSDDSGTNVSAVTITIQLNEPKDQEQYLKIAGEAIILTFSFTIADIEF